MKLLSSNYTQKFFTTKIVFRFDEVPYGAEEFELEYEDPETEIITSVVISGVIDNTTVVFDEKFPADEFIMTNIFTGDSIHFEIELVEGFKNELIFVNEDGYPTTYLKGFQAEDIYQVIVKTPDGEVWNTYKYGDRTIGGSTGTNDLSKIEGYTRICFDSEYGWMTSKFSLDGGIEQMGVDLRKVVIEIELWEALEIKTFKKLLPVSTEEKDRITMYQGVLDYDELGID